MDIPLMTPEEMRESRDRCRRRITGEVDSESLAVMQDSLLGKRLTRIDLSCVGSYPCFLFTAEDGTRVALIHGGGDYYDDLPIASLDE